MLGTFPKGHWALSGPTDFPGTFLGHFRLVLRGATQGHFFDILGTLPKGPLVAGFPHYDAIGIRGNSKKLGNWKPEGIQKNEI